MQERSIAGGDVLPFIHFAETEAGSLEPGKAWNGYTLHDAPDTAGVVPIDMNGRVLKRWPAPATSSGVFRLLPGG